MSFRFAILNGMKTTVDIPEKDLAEVMRHTHAKTKTEAVALAVADFNRRQRLAKLANKLGTFRDMMTIEDLRKMRGTG
jgi:Arc/MetJ family transcription regulator